MQRHKKYLIVTIWISTIAFIGAGFVGWGGYDFNSQRARSVAVVGKNAISKTDFNYAYNGLFNYYSQMRNGQFTEEDAEKLGLAQSVLASMIDEQMLLNYAEELSLKVSDDEVASVLLADPNFSTNGTFDKAKYEQLVRNARSTPKDYEEGLRRTLLLAKLNDALGVERVGDVEKEILGAVYFMQDRLSVKVVERPTNLQLGDDALRAFWEKNKDKYKSKTKFDLSRINIPVKLVEASEEELLAHYKENRGEYRDSEDKLLTFAEAKKSVVRDYSFSLVKTKALELYAKVKKGEAKTEENLSVFEDDTVFESEIFARLRESKAGDVLRPFAKGENFVILKVEKVEPPRVLSFDEAKKFVYVDALEEEKNKALVEKASGELKGFVGSDIGFVGRDFAGNFAGLNAEETTSAIEQIFNKNQKEGFVLFKDKAFLYKITEQKFLNSAKFENFGSTLQNGIRQIKNAELKRDILNVLRKRYEVKVYDRGQQDGN